MVGVKTVLGGWSSCYPRFLSLILSPHARADLRPGGLAYLLVLARNGRRLYERLINQFLERMEMCQKTRNIKWLGLLVLLGVIFPFADGQAGERRESPIRIVFAGDLGWGESYQDKYEKLGRGNVLKEKGYDHGMQNLTPLLSGADLVVANLETPVARTTTSPFSGEKDYIHYADPEMTTAALKRHRIDVVSLANNHTNDLGQEGLLETIGVLTAKGISIIGAGANNQIARVPYRKVFTRGEQRVNVYVLSAFEYNPGYDSKYRCYAAAECPGVASLDTQVLAAQVLALRKNDPEAFIVFFPHWGENYRWRSEEQERQAHACIDAGVDLIIGHGAHMMQEVERYRGKWIFYSLGNFMFNSRGRYSSMGAEPFSLVVVLEFEPNTEGFAIFAKLYPIVSDNRITNYQPKPVTSEEFKRVTETLFARSPGSSSWGALATSDKTREGYCLTVSVR